MRVSNLLTTLPLPQALPTHSSKYREKKEKKRKKPTVFNGLRGYGEEEGGTTMGVVGEKMGRTLKMLLPKILVLVDLYLFFCQCFGKIFFAIRKIYSSRKKSLELGVFFIVINYICLSSVQIYACFYFNYIIYYGLLIFCCQSVATKIYKNHLSI